jgi:hypothetical protein
MFQKIFVVFISVAMLVSCGGKPAEIIAPPEPVNPPVIVEDIEVPEQHNVVTPEFWESFETDMKVVYFYSKIDSLQIHLPLEKELAKSYCETNGIAYHEYYTNDNMGLVQLSDTLFFDLTDNLMKNKEGFLLLKKGKLKDLGFDGLNQTILQKELSTFFQ